MSNFSEWLRSQLEEKKISQTELARMIRVTPAQVSRILSGERSTSPDALVNIAHVIKVSPVTIFRKAGILPPGPENEVKFEDWEYILDQLPPEDEEELRRLAELKIERRKKDGSLKSLKSKKA